MWDGATVLTAPVQWRRRIGICLAPPSLVSFTNLVLLHCSVGECCRQLHLKLCALLLLLSLRIDRRSGTISTDQRSQREVKGAGWGGSELEKRTWRVNSTEWRSRSSHGVIAYRNQLRLQLFQFRFQILRRCGALAAFSAGKAHDVHLCECVKRSVMYGLR